MVVDDSDMEERLNLGKLVAFISVLKNFEMIIEQSRLFSLSGSNDSFLGLIFDTLENSDVNILSMPLFGKKSLVEQIMVSFCVFVHTLTSDSMKAVCQFLLSRLLQTRSPFVELLIFKLFSYVAKSGTLRLPCFYSLS